MPHLHDDEIIVSRAIARFQRVTARKARMVAVLIRNKTVSEARNILEFTHRPSAGPMIYNVLKSAVANVDHAKHPDADSLILGEVEVNDGPIMKRMMPKARGRGASIKKRFCHISIKLIEA